MIFINQLFNGAPARRRMSTKMVSRPMAMRKKRQIYARFKKPKLVGCYVPFMKQKQAPIQWQMSMSPISCLPRAKRYIEGPWNRWWLLSLGH